MATDNLKAQVTFFAKWGRMLESGVPMMQSLQVLQEETEDDRLKQVAARLIEQVSNQQSVGGTLREFPDSFGPFVISLVDAGELEGNLEQTLIKIAEGLEKQADYGA